MTVPPVVLLGAAAIPDASLSANPRTLRSIQHSLGLSLLEKLVSKLGINAMPEISVGPSGKPYFPEMTELHFNISHSGKYAAAAVSDFPVGIDIERDRPLKKALTERFLGGVDSDIAVREWTRREAYGKLTGRGFFYGDIKIPHATGEYSFSSGGERYLITLCVENGGSGTVGLVPSDPKLPDEITWY